MGHRTLCAEHLCVEVSDSAGGSVGESEHGASVEGDRVEVVVERTVLVELRDEEQLRPRTCSLDVSCHKTCNNTIMNHNIQTSMTSAHYETRILHIISKSIFCNHNCEDRL